MNRSLLFLLAIPIATALGFSQIMPCNASAVTASDWRAGRIIDDGIFTNAGAMSVVDIQNFLNSKVPNCDTWGTQPASDWGRPDLTHAQYAASRGWPGPPYVCLRNYYEVPKTEPGPGIPINNFQTGGNPPAGSISAAQMIYNAAQRYQINPKVLLVTIQKESIGPLTTDTWPLEKQYTYAMGAYCPDSGPGGSANCDPNYAGFSIQIAQSARLMRYYLDNMQQSWWTYKKPFQNNFILWNVEPTGCGGGNVFIETKATAALYTYTPYQPNQVALNNMYGIGDRCSAYGNRNFWRIYWDWFGNPINSNPYSWSVSGQYSYVDPQRTIQYSATPTVLPGGVFYGRIKARNVGGTTWQRPVVKLAPSRPIDKPSQYYTPSWLDSSRVTHANEVEVRPGDTATFDFEMKMPQNPGVYNQYFNIVAEGIQWMNDPGLFYEINVSQSKPLNNANRSKLKQNEAITSSEYLLSGDELSTLGIENGMIVLRTNFYQSWSSVNKGSNSDTLVMQSDGNLVQYRQDGAVVWASNTFGNPGAYLTLQSDGNLVIYSSSNTPLWSTGTVHYPVLYQYTLNKYYTSQVDGKAMPRQYMSNAKGTRKLILQTDGNLVLYDNNYKALWASGTSGKPVKSFVIQQDGNLVLYDQSQKPVWASWTNGNENSKLVLQEDGNLVLYNQNSLPVWHTGTYK